MNADAVPDGGFEEHAGSGDLVAEIGNDKNLLTVDIEDDDQFEGHIAAIGKQASMDLRAHMGTSDDAENGSDLKKLLSEALKSGFATGTPLAQRMNRVLTEAQKNEYKACQGHKAKQEWRMKWAKVTFDTIQKEKTFTESWDVEDTTIGESLSLSRIQVNNFPGSGFSRVSAATRWGLTGSNPPG